MFSRWILYTPFFSSISIVLTRNDIIGKTKTFLSSSNSERDSNLSERASSWIAVSHDSGKQKFISTFIWFDDATGGMNKQAIALAIDVEQKVFVQIILFLCWRAHW